MIAPQTSPRRPGRSVPAARLVVIAGCLLLLLVAGVVAAGPGKREPRRVAAPDRPGSIAGVVELAGKPPARAALARGSDPVCGKATRLDEAVVASDGKLRDVHVRIAVGTAGKHAAPTSSAVIDQVDCMYSPRVLGVMQGQKIAINNKDATYHNVHGTRGKRTVWNHGQPARAPAIVAESPGAAGDVIVLGCDVHPWMRAYAVITDHPYFAVTGDDGSFTIASVPPGTYTLEAWHPELGTKTTKVTIRAGETSAVTFRF